MCSYQTIKSFLPDRSKSYLVNPSSYRTDLHYENECATEAVSREPSVWEYVPRAEVLPHNGAVLPVEAVEGPHVSQVIISKS